MPSVQEKYDGTTVDDVLGEFIGGKFYPKMDCVHHLLFKLDGLEIALRGGNKSAMAELELGEAYLEEYVRHCKYMVTIYAFSDRELRSDNQEHWVSERLMWVRSNPNAVVTDSAMRIESGLSREIKPNKTPETLRSISGNLRFGFFANSVLRKYRTIRHYVTRDVGMLSEAAEMAKSDFYFYKNILPTYGVGPSTGIPWLEYDESDFYNFAFEAYQDFAKLGKKKEASEMELEIREALSASPNMYWGLYYYRLKFIQTGKNEFLLKLRDVGESIVKRIDSGEVLYFEKDLAKTHVIFAEAVLFSDLNKVEQGLELIESALKKNEQCGPSLPNTYYGDLSYEGLMSLFRMYGIFIALQRNETTVSELSEAVEGMLDVQTDWKFRQEYDFNGSMALKFLLFLHLSHMEEMDSEIISNSIEAIDSIIADHFSNPIYTEVEIRYFQIAKSILENLGNDAYVPQTEFCLEEVRAPGCELALDVRMFGLVLAYTKTVRMRRFTGKENIYRMVYESLVEIGRMRPTFSQLGEEAIRDVLCDKLNSKMRAHVARTEVKRGKGKTDICIESKNLDEPMFQIILECLVWNGGEHYTKKKKQLFGYLDVTDTDAGLVTFSKKGNFKMVLDKAMEIVPLECDYVAGSLSKTKYAYDLHNFALSTSHRNDGGKIVELKHFFINLSTD